MRLESALFTSREGLTVHGQALSVVGDNISNLNTTGFKKSRSEFADLLPEGRDGYRSEASPVSGSGVSLSEVRTIFENGVIESTGRSLDVGIDGNGFFLVGDAASPAYSRAGNFSVDANGLLVSGNGLPVLGFAADSTTLGPLSTASLNLNGTETTEAQLFGNLTADAPLATVPANPENFEDIGTAASFIASDVTMYDSLGNSRPLTIAFYRTEASTWTAQAYIDGGEVGGVAGTPVQVGQDTALTFNTAGQIEEANAAAAVITGTPAYNEGAAQGNFTIDLSDLTQFAGTSLINQIIQNGEGTGNINGFKIEQNGSLFAELDTGANALIGDIPLAMFTSNDGLVRAGSTLYRDNGDAGTRSIGTPGEEGRGSLTGGALERSAVDVANEFVDIVVYQRGYQANSQVLNTTNQMLRDTIGLIR